MKILFVVNEVPLPPDNGVRIVSHNAMQLMAGLGHQLGLAVLTHEEDETQERFLRISKICQPGMSFLQQLPKRKSIDIFIRALFSLRLFFIERYRNPQFGQALSKLIDDFQPDVIHFDIITMLQYRSLVPSGVGTVASVNDSYSLTLENQLRIGHYPGFGKIYRYIQYWQTRRYEKNCYPKFGAVHVMSEVDANFLKHLNLEINTCVVPNGVAVELLTLCDQTMGATEVVFVAKLADDNLVNLRKFLATSWPIVMRECPAAKLSVVGKLTPGAEILRAEVEQPGSLEFKGYVGDLLDVYRTAGIAIVPIDKNCGIINKALEGMAAGLAVVGFSNAFAGIAGVCFGVNCVAVDDYKSFGSAIVKLIKNDEYRRGIQRQASELIKTRHTWAMRSRAYENMYRTANLTAGLTK